MKKADYSDKSKSMKLTERNQRGRFWKGETFSFYQMRNIILFKRSDYFNHWLFGSVRRGVLEVVFGVFTELIDLDMPGQSKLMGLKNRGKNAKQNQK